MSFCPVNPFLAFETQQLLQRQWHLVLACVFCVVPQKSMGCAPVCPQYPADTPESKRVVMTPLSHRGLSFWADFPHKTPTTPVVTTGQTS